MRRIFQLSNLAPLEKLRLRTSSAYAGTVTEPGPLVSDGRVIFDAGRVVPAAQPLADEVAARSRPTLRRAVPQSEAAALFASLAQDASRRAHLLGQAEKPLWLQASALDHVAVLRYGRGGSTRYVLLDAHRLLLLHRLTAFDEICCDRGHHVLLRAKGLPVGGLTSLPVAPDVVP